MLLVSGQAEYQKGTTSNSECYKVPSAKIDIFKNFYFVKTPSDWNKLTDSVICAKALDSFETAVQKLD